MNIDDNNVHTPTDGAGKPVAFCQNCGRPLDDQTVRIVGPAVYCEPCLEARLRGAPAGTAAGGGAAGAADTVWQWGSGMPAGWRPGSVPNPGLAGLLGVIPGVGAMYNEQYAKGIFHLLVFAVLISLSHSVGVFGLFAFGWICYMVIEAHHTARARRDGTPLPNPFGLNDLGERLGFGRAWPGSIVPPAAAARAQPYAPPGPADSAANPYTAPAYTAPNYAGPSYPAPVYPVAEYSAPGSVPSAAPSSSAPLWGAPVEGFNREAFRNAAQEQHAYWTNLGSQYGSNYSSNYGAQSYAQTAPPLPPFGVPYAPVSAAGIPEAAYLPKPNRFPAGAIWLIGLGALFLLSTTGIFHALFGWSLVGFVLIGLAVWAFVQRLTNASNLPGLDSPAGPLPRVVRALWSSVWLFAVGVLLLLNEFDVLPWHRSWPLFIILAGVMGLLRRAAYNANSRSWAAAAYGGSEPGAARAGAGPELRVVPSPGTPDESASHTSHDADTHEGGL